MEKISAACAMEWSIEFEKGLRSKRPGQQIEAIKQIGSKLQQWSKDPSITMGISDMFGLIPGEDRTFANTILLRLADAFRCGDNSTRCCIVNVFLLELRHLTKKGKQYDGILAKRKVPNYVELLKRVKIVFDTGDVEARGLALRLFGCWADLAKDSLQIRYMILSTLQSSHVSEVKASLFAVGCFSGLSEDFACIVMEILIDIVSSSKATFDVKLAAIRVFSKMRCSSFIASLAYKAGKKMVVGSLQDELMAEMLSSTSKLALKSTLLIPEQVDLLLSYLRCEAASFLKATALKCLYFLFAGGACCFPVNRNVLPTLFHLIDDNDLELNLQCEALRILRKIFCSTLPDLDMPELCKMVLLVENAAQSLIKSKRCLALGLLVDISCNLMRSRRGHGCLYPEEWHFTCFPSQEASQAIASVSGGNGPAHLVCRVISVVIDQITSLMKRVNVGSGGGLIFMENLKPSSGLSEVKVECQSLLSNILRIVEVFPASGLLALDRVRYLIETLFSAHNMFKIGCTGTSGEASQTEIGVEKSSSVSWLPECDRMEQIFFISELKLCICRFTNVCLKTLDEAGAVNSEVYHMVKLLVECIQQSELCNCDMYFRLLMHCYLVCHSYDMNNDMATCLNKSKVGADLRFSYTVCWVDQECRTLEFTKKAVEGRNYWPAYRAGKYSACGGLWFAATFTFRKLMDGVHSNSCRYWLRSLMLMAGGECEIKLLLFPKVGVQLINMLQAENDCGKPFTCVEGEMDQCIGGNIDLSDCGGKLARACRRICSSEEILAATGVSVGVYYFQRWYLSLRAKVLQILVDTCELLRSHAFTDENYKNDCLLGGNDMIQFPARAQDMHSLVLGFACISFRLHKLAKEYDLLATSFMDIDCRSARSISKVALGCSLLAFCTAFALCFSESPAFENVMDHNLGNLEKPSRTVLIQDLFERVSDMDDKIAMELQQFMTVAGGVMDNLQSRGSGNTDRASLLVYRFSILGILHMQEEAKRANDICLLFMRGKQLLSDVIIKWMEIPFQIPKYFFRVRPCIGTELFIFNADTRNKDEISISCGSQLSLNLCIQLKNASMGPHVRVAKMYCILAASSSNLLSSGGLAMEKQMQWGFQPQKTNEMVELNEMLLLYIRNDIKKASRIHAKVRDGDDLVTSCVCFEPSDKGQGFSACLLDVSAFPEGSYQIKWHSCCVDDNGSYWSLLPLNTAPVFTVKQPSTAA